MLTADVATFEPARKRLLRRWPRSPLILANVTSLGPPTRSSDTTFCSTPPLRDSVAVESPREGIEQQRGAAAEQCSVAHQALTELEDSPHPRCHLFQAAYMHLHREEVAMTAASHGGSRGRQVTPLAELRRGSAQTLRLDVDGIDLGGARVEGGSPTSSSGGYVALDSAAWKLPEPNFEQSSATTITYRDQGDEHGSWQDHSLKKGYRHMFDCVEHHGSEDTFAAHLRHDCTHAHPIHNAETVLEAQARRQFVEGGHVQALGISTGLGGEAGLSSSQGSGQPSFLSHEQVLGGFASLGPSMGPGPSAASTKGGSSGRGQSSTSSTPALEGMPFTHEASQSATLIPSSYDASETLDLLTIDEMGQHSINVGSTSDWIGTRMSTAAASSKGWAVARATTRARKWIVAPDCESSGQAKISRAIIVSDHVSGAKADSFVGSQSSTTLFQHQPNAPPVFELRALRAKASPSTSASSQTIILAGPSVHRELMTAQHASVDASKHASASSAAQERRHQSIRHDPLPLVEARRPSLGKSFSTEALPIGPPSYAMARAEQLKRATSPTRHSTPPTAFAPGHVNAGGTLGADDASGAKTTRDAPAPFGNYTFGVSLSPAAGSAAADNEALMPPDLVGLRGLSPRTSLTGSAADLYQTQTHAPLSVPMNGHNAERKSRGADKRLADWFRKRRVLPPNSPSMHGGADLSIDEMNTESSSLSTREQKLRLASTPLESSLCGAPRDSSEVQDAEPRPSSKALASSPSLGSTRVEAAYGSHVVRDARTRSAFVRGEPLRKAMTSQQLGEASPSSGKAGVQANTTLARVRSTSGDVALGASQRKELQRDSPTSSGTSKGTHDTNVYSSSASDFAEASSVRQRSLRRPRSIASGMISRTAKSTPTSDDFSLLAEVLAQDSTSSTSPTSDKQHAPTNSVRTDDRGSSGLSWVMQSALIGTDLDASQAGSLMMVIPLFSAVDSRQQPSRPRRYIRIAYVPFDTHRLGASPVNAFALGQREMRGAATPPLQLPAASLSPDSHNPTWYRKLASALGHHASEQHASSEKELASAVEWPSPDKAKHATLQRRHRSPTVGPFRVTALVLPASDDAFGRGHVHDLPDPFTFPLVLAMCDARRRIEFVPEGWAALGLAEGPLLAGRMDTASMPQSSGEGCTQVDALQHVADFVTAGCAAIMDL